MNRWFVSRTEYDALQSAKERGTAIAKRLAYENDDLSDEIANLVGQITSKPVESDREVVTQAEYDEMAKARCANCGGVHLIACPRVKRIRFSPGGQTPSEVEFWPDGEWPKDRVKWLEEITVEAPAS